MKQIKLGLSGVFSPPLRPNWSQSPVSANEHVTTYLVHEGQNTVSPLPPVLTHEEEEEVAVFLFDQEHRPEPGEQRKTGV